jgi:hypothetical protein
MPWRTLRKPDPQHRYVVSAGVFEVNRARYVPRFLRHAARVRRILPTTDGLIGFTLLARFRTRTFIEIAAFENPDAMRRFAAQPEHAAAVRALLPHIGGGSKLVTIEMYGRDLPPRREHVAARLEAAPALGEHAGSSGRAVDRSDPAVPSGAHAGPARPAGAPSP